MYAGVVLVLNLAQIGLLALLKSQHVPGTLIWGNVALGGFNLLVIFLLFGAVIAAISRAVAWVHLGEPATIRGAYQSVLPHLGRYLWLMTITAFRVWTPVVLLYGGFLGTILFYGPKGLGAHAGATAQQTAATNPQATVAIIVASVAFFLLLIPVGIYTILMSLRYSLAIPACVVEEMKARQAIRRSIDLAKGSWGRIFLLVLLVGVIKMGLVGFAQAFVVVSAFKSHGQIGPGLSAISQIIAFFTNTFLGPILATGITLFYFDQRVRKEGYDIEWMMRGAGLTVPEPATELQTITGQDSAVIEPQPALDAHFAPPPLTPEVGPCLMTTDDKAAPGPVAAEVLSGSTPATQLERPQTDHLQQSSDLPRASEKLL